MKKLLLLVTLSFIIPNLNAQTTYTYTGTGYWTNAANWSPSYPGTTIVAGDTVIINGNVVEVDIINAGHLTISSSGSITTGINSGISNTGTLINEGTLIATEFGGFSAFISTSGTLSNTGTITIGLGSSVDVTGSLINTGVIEIQPVANLFFSQNATIENSGTGIINNNGSFNTAATFTNMATINNVASLTNTGLFTNGQLLDISGTFTNNGTFVNTQTVENTGAFVNNDQKTATNNGTFNNTNSVTNNGIFVNAQTLNNTGTFVNNATLENTSLFNNTGTLTIAATGTMLNLGTYTNEGTIENNGTITNNGTLNNPLLFTNNGNYTNNNIFNNTGTLNCNGAFTNTIAFSNVGIINIETQGTLTISQTIDNQATGSITNAGTVTTLALGTLNNFGTFSNTNATFTNAGTVVNNTNANFEVTDNTSMHLFRNQATFTNHGTLTLTLASSPSNTNTGTINNTGVFDIPNNFPFTFPNQGTIANHGVFTINTDLINDGVFLNTNEFNGSYRGSGSFANEGIIMGGYIVIRDFGLLTNTGTINTTAITMFRDSQIFTNEGVVKILGGENGFRLSSKIVNNNIIEILPDGIAGLSNDTFINNGTLLNRGTLSTIVFGFPVIATLHNSETGVIDNRATLVIDVTNDGMPSTLTNEGAIINTGTYTNNGVLVNNGTITNSNALNNGGSIAIEAMGTLSTSGTTSNQATGSITNAGTITTLELGTFTNAGTITMDTTGTLSTSGTASNQATASITNAGTITTLELGTFLNAGAITINAMATLSTTGTTNNQTSGIINNSGTVTIPMLGTLTNFGSFTNNTNATVTNAGTLVNNTNANFESPVNTSMHSFTNQATLTNHGTFTVRLSSSLINTSTAILTNTGVFNITINNNSSPINQGTITNHGVLTINGQFIRLVNEGVFLNTNEFSGSYQGPGSFTNEGIIMGGSIIIEDFGLLTNTGTINTTVIAMRPDSQVFTNEGVVKIFGGETGFRFSRKIVNNNIIEILPDGIAGLSNDTFINNGTLINRGTLSTIVFGFPVIATLHNSETGVIDNRATLVIDTFDDGTPSTLINDGTIINTGTYTNSGALVNNGGFTNNNIFDNSGTFSNPGILSGINTSHTQDFTNAGTLSPGNSTGTYTFNNNYSAQTTANLQIELENTTTFDIVTVTGTAAIDGTLEVTLLNNYSPIVGDTFTILTAGNISGTFDTVNLPAGYNWDVVYTATEVILEIIPITINPVVFLQGALLSNGNTSVMRDDLRSLGYLPTTSPYTDGLTCNASVFNTGGTNGTGNTNNDIVDWIWIELRDATDNTLVIDGQSALLQRDGDVVSIDGISVVSFNQASGDYYLAIKHRNHLAVMTTNTIALNRTATTINFTESTTPITFGTNAQATIAGTPNVLALWAGNANEDQLVQYSGTSPDSPSILSNVLNDAGNFLNFPTYSVSGYNTNDIDMNGSTQYSGTAPDTPFILQNVLAHSGNFLNFSTYPIEEQLPEN